RIALAGQEGLEPPTTGFGDRDSGQLSYCPESYNAPAGPCRKHTGTLPQRQHGCRSMQCTSEPPVRRTAWLRPAEINDARSTERGWDNGAHAYESLRTHLRYLR